MLVAEDSEPQVIRVWDVDKVIMTEESIRSNGPSGLRFCLVGEEKRVIRECSQDVGIKLFLVHDNGRTENRGHKVCSTELHGNLFLSKHRM